MARIVNQNQQITTGVLQPASIYSRQVGVELVVPAGVGAQSFNYTPPLGTNLRVYQIDFYAFGILAGQQIGGFINITKGNGKPASFTEAATQWEPVMQYVGIKPSIYYWQYDHFHLHWEMNKLYTGEAVRFACAVENFNSANGWYAHCWFQISEG